MAPRLVCLGTNDQISPAVFAGVGVDFVGFSAQVPASKISGLSFTVVGATTECRADFERALFFLVGSAARQSKEVI